MSKYTKEAVFATLAEAAVRQQSASEAAAETAKKEDTCAGSMAKPNMLGDVEISVKSKSPHERQIIISSDETPIEFIMHLADIHIGSDRARTQEYKMIFDTFVRHIETFPHKERLAIVIAGDVFHNKTRLYADDIILFDHLMESLHAFPVIVIPGNHDANLNDKSQMDLITPLVSKHKNAYYWKESGIYGFRGLDFAHVSVFDESNDISWAFAQTHIVLFHGMINSARYGNQICSESKINKKLINQAKLVLAGDIHEHQFITQNCAYPGSLIQQNLGEANVAKGYICWDLKSGRGRFVHLANANSFVRIDVRGKSAEEAQEIISKMHVPNQVIRVGLLSDAADAALCEQILQLRKKVGRVDNVSHTAPIMQIDQLEILRGLLAEKNVVGDAAEKILQMHSTNYASYESRRWHLLSMTWDNLYKYGPGNHIDFTTVGSIAGVIAPNRAGKSSIFDILVFGLFNVLLRGTRESLTHFGAKNSHLSVDFQCNDKQYRISRTDTTTSRRIICSLFMRERIKNSTASAMSRAAVADEDTVESAPNGECEDEINFGPYVNISGSSVDETYKKIKKIIGSYENFLTCGLYYGSSNDIIQMSRQQRMRILPELFGVEDGTEIVKQLSSKIKDTKEQINQLVKPRFDPTADIAKIQADIESLTSRRREYALKYDAATIYPQSREDIEADLANISIRVRELEPLISTPVGPAEPTEQIILSPNDLERLRLVVSSYEANPVPESPAALMSVKDEANIRLGVARQLIADLSGEKVLQQRIDKAKSDIDTTLKRLADIGGDTEFNIAIHPPAVDIMYATDIELASMRRIVREYVAPDQNTQNLRTKFRQLQIAVATRHGSSPEERDELTARRDVLSLLESDEKFKDKNIVAASKKIPADLFAELAKLEALIAEIPDISHIEGIEKDCADLARQVNLPQTQQCGPNCGGSDCVQKAGNGVVSLLVRVRARKDAIKKKRAESLETNAKIRQMREIIVLALQYREISNELSSVMSALQAADDYKSLTAEMITAQQIIYAEDRYKDALAKLNKCEAYEKYTLMVVAHKKHLELSDLKGKLARVQTATALMTNDENVVKNISAKLAIIKSYEDAIDTIDKHKRWCQYSAWLKYSKASEEFNSLSSRKSALERMLPNAPEDSSPNSLKSITSELKIIDTALGSKMATLAALKKEQDIAKEYEKSMPPLSAELARYKSYLECLGPQGFQTKVIEKSLSHIVSRTNIILSNITDFRLEATFDGADVEFFIVDGARMSADMASGFQRFIISIAFRLALTSNIYAAPEFLMIDEGFGCMDKANIANLANMFAAISGMYKFIFVISHIDELQNIINIPIHIKTNNGVSHIHYRGLANVSSEAPGACPSKVQKTAAPVSNINAKLPVPIAATIKCTCGSDIRRDSLSRHLVSKKHIASLSR